MWPPHPLVVWAVLLILGLGSMAGAHIPPGSEGVGYVIGRLILFVGLAILYERWHRRRVANPPAPPDA